MESVAEFGEIKEPAVLAVSYDEFDIDVTLTYSGILLELPNRPPSQEELLESDDGPRLLAGFMVKRLADKVEAVTEGGRHVLKMHFRQ